MIKSNGVPAGDSTGWKNYIVDFMCKELMLVIEVDGITHQFEETIQKDI
jgi:very-short-patch-repair endonuclease